MVAIRSPFTPTGSMTVGRPTVLFAGVMLQSVIVPDPGGTIPPLHLGVAAPADAVIELVESEGAQEMVARLLPPSGLPDN